MLKIKMKKKLMIPILALILVVVVAGTALAVDYTPNPQITSFPTTRKDSRSYNGYALFIQRVLFDYGYSSCDPDGYFGSITKSCVQLFQTAEGITSDGIVGGYTWIEAKEELDHVTNVGNETRYLGSYNAWDENDLWNFTMYNDNAVDWFVLHENSAFQCID